MPTGVGVYVRNISRAKHTSAATLAERCHKYGLSFVALQACWQDDKTGEHRDSNLGKLASYGAALRDQGIDVWVWGYPLAGSEDRFVDRMIAGAREAGAVGLLLDPEVSYVRRPEDARRLVSLTIDALDESLGLGITSFGMCNWHYLPWQELQVGWGSPQVYTVDGQVLTSALEQWREGWHHVVPSIAAFGKHSGRSMIDRVSLFRDCPGVIVWSYQQISGAEWQVLSEFGDTLRYGS